MIARERKGGPLFIFSYLAANHFPWDHTFRPDLTPDWRKLGNVSNVDEYVRRQGMSERDYAAFLERLRRDFPDELFMLVRFGDHQPDFAEHIIDPKADDDEVADRLDAMIPRYLHHLLRNRHDQFQTGRSVVGAPHAGGAVFTAGRPGGGGLAARPDLCRAEADPAALQRPVLRLR